MHSARNKLQRYFETTNLYKAIPFLIYYLIINYEKLNDVEKYYLAFFQFAIIYGVIIAFAHLKTFSKYLDSFYFYAPFSIVSLGMFVDWSITLFLLTIEGPANLYTPLIFLFNLSYGMAHLFPVWIFQIGIFSFGYYMSLFIIFAGEKMILNYMRFRRQKPLLSPINQG